ncbi:hypothetical protein J6590_048410 [Homalodisca vitripennis]|nr:hypothetical protein J6590_048410 [Homalodisca vitripennis]
MRAEEAPRTPASCRFCPLIGRPMAQMPSRVLNGVRYSIIGRLQSKRTGTDPVDSTPPSPSETRSLGTDGETRKVCLSRKHGECDKHRYLTSTAWHIDPVTGTKAT